VNAERGRWLKIPSSVGFGVSAIALLHAWSSRSRYLYEADSLGFAFGMHEYAVNKDQRRAGMAAQALRRDPAFTRDLASSAVTESGCAADRREQRTLSVITSSDPRCR
jgi:hypothetical protein